eukprot:TRINITY_DN1552_c0_g1_i1.p2 TRINITY_DN1552_c0_g1~~TRINITY_DN1552_c0_g1_i1.p2  ORF type:complete len:314 (+),score=144.54 TRINITY_DN1552_c0_g1_i1:225-1166(+)
MLKNANANAGEEAVRPLRRRMSSGRLTHDAESASRRAESLKALDKFNAELATLHRLMTTRPLLRHRIHDACTELRDVEDRLDTINLRMSGGSSIDIGARSDEDSDAEEFRDREATLMREMMQSERSSLSVRKMSLERDAKRVTKSLNAELEELDSTIDQQLDVLVGVIEADLAGYSSHEVPAESVFARVAFALMRAKYQTDGCQVNLTSDPGCGYDIEIENPSGGLSRLAVFARALQLDDAHASSVVREIVGACALAGVQFATVFVKSLDEEAVGYDLDRAIAIGIEIEVIPMRRFKELIRLYLSDAKLSEFL